ncbi:SMI1/KNR4 family protein [Neobacillus niacini]|uniref:SMI1/KNR4 family protein n=1 Tax=Neobacillus niacini TaxID=86668 RepID=UPI0006939806|nr:SMI1/KNR4 family protein [Neobacillus niacini]
MINFSISNVLEALKTRLDEDNLLNVHSTSGVYTKVGFNFNKPITHHELEQFIINNDLNLPTEYKEFLLLHNGAEFFTYEYGYSFCLYSIEEMIRTYNSMKDYCDVDYILKYCYPIGYVMDGGTLLLDHSEFKKTNVLLSGIETKSFYCDLKTWLERMIIAQGNAYWEWFSKVVHFD